MSEHKGLVTAIAALCALFVILMAAYGVSALLDTRAPGTIAAGEDVYMTAPPAAEAIPGSACTAKGALDVASRDAGVQAWTGGRSEVSVASVTSDFCSSGEAEAWTVVYGAGDEHVAVQVEGGAVVGIVDTSAARTQGIATSGLIDSDQAWRAIEEDVMAGAAEMPGTVSMALKTLKGRPCWDVSYKIDDSYRIIRVDATTGAIAESAVLRP